MGDLTKYQGIFPAFYACYDEKGFISPEGVRALTEHLIQQGVNGLYVGGSSGECIYHSVAERKIVLENVVKQAKGRVAIIAHVACNNTADSKELAAHAQSLGVDAIAAIPPIYFKLPDRAIAKYWNDISAAAPHTDFIIYNIPQLAGVALSPSLLKTMVQNPNVIGVKNSSMPVQDIENWRDQDVIVFNGPDGQLLSGLTAGAIGGIGGTYGAMPKLYLKIYNLFLQNKITEARELMDECRRMVQNLCSAQGSMYAVIKGVLRINAGVDCGGVREPLYNLVPEDQIIVDRCAKGIQALEARYL